MWRFKMEQREIDIQKLCDSVKNHHIESTCDYGSGGQCPFCFKACAWNANDVSEIEHELDCVVLIAKDLSVGVSLPTIDDINKFINEHKGNTGSILLDKAVDAGFREGAKFVINWVNRNER